MLGFVNIFRFSNIIHSSTVLELLSSRPSLIRANKFCFWSREFSTMAKAVKIFQVVFVLGAPGSGKGTQCTRLVEEFGFVHLSAGELLRGEIRQASQDGALIQKLIDEGKIVPVDITCRLLQKSMEASSSNRFLIDGFPRNKDNVDGWERIIGKAADVKFCLFLDCPKEVCLARIIGRHDGSGRTDDTPEKFQLRIDTFFKETIPIVEYFRSIEKLRAISSIGSISEVFSRVKPAFEKCFPPEKTEP